jgi:hypothetical protein
MKSLSTGRDRQLLKVYLDDEKALTFGKDGPSLSKGRRGCGCQWLGRGSKVLCSHSQMVEELTREDEAEKRDGECGNGLRHVSAVLLPFFLSLPAPAHLSGDVPSACKDTILPSTASSPT